MKYLLSGLTVLLLAATAVQAQFTFTTNNGAITIKKYTGVGQNTVAIPGITNGMPVVSIGTNAFYEADVTSVIIPNSITNIGNDAFENCTLSSVIIPNSVISLGSQAFYSSGLTNVVISGGVASMGTNVFQYCASLISVTLSNGVTTIGTNAFYSCLRLASVSIPDSVTNLADDAFYDDSSLASITLSLNLTSLGNYVFEGCSGLVSVYFPGNAPSVGSSVFASDSKAVIYYWPGTTGWSSPFAGITAVLFPFTYLASPGGVTIDGFSGSVAAVVIPATIDDVPVTSIGTAAFASNPIPTSITIPASITNIGVGAFAFCPNLKTITMGTPNLYYSSVNGVLYNQSLTTLIQYPGGLTGSYVIPDGVTNLVAGACAGAKLTAVTIVNTVTSIGIGAFSGCASLTTINVVTPNSFYSGSGGVLFNQGQTTLLQAPGGLKGNYVIPSSVTSIGAGAFQYCSSLTGVTLTTNVTSIGNSAFAASGLTSLTIPGCVTNLGGQVFAGCASLTNALISSGVPAIGAGDFGQCSKLTSVTIAGSVTNLDDNAFANCPSLTNVVFSGNAPAADLTVFTGDANAMVYYLYGTTGWSNPFAGLPAALWLPFGYTSVAGGVAITNFIGPGGAVIIIPPTLGGLPVTSIGNGAFEGSGLIGITLPASITSIGNSAFQSSGLASVNIPCGVTNLGNQAFYESSLTSVTIPYSVITIGSFAFGDCAHLTNVYFMGGLPFFANEGIFEGDNVTLYYFPDAGAASEWYYDFYPIPTVQWTPYSYTTNAGGITFTGYSGPGVTAFLIPPTINGLPVTGIAAGAFAGSSLTGFIIPGTVTNLGTNAFANGTNLTSLYFTGNAPAVDSTVFAGDTNATAYYLYGTTGWNSPFDGLPTTLWLPFSYVTNAGSITLTGCTVPAGTAIIIPPTLNGLPVTSIASDAFNDLDLVSVTIPDTVTNLGNDSFSYSGFGSVTIPGSVLGLGTGVFEDDYNLTNAVILDGSTSIGFDMFFDCPNLVQATIPGSVTNLGTGAFGNCKNLTGIYFTGNAPATNSSIFAGDSKATVYYLPGTTGWGTNFAGAATALWLPQIQTSDGGFGVQNRQFGFNLSWAGGQVVEVDACTNLANPVWTPLQTLTLTNGAYYFSEPQWTNYPARFYRLTSP